MSPSCTLCAGEGDSSGLERLLLKVTSRRGTGTPELQQGAGLLSVPPSPRGLHTQTCMMS